MGRRLSREQLHLRLDYIRELLIKGWTHDQIFTKIKEEDKFAKRQNYDMWVHKLYVRDNEIMRQEAIGKLSHQLSVCDERMQKHYKMAEEIAKDKNTESADRLRAISIMEQINIDQVRAARSGSQAISQTTLELINNDNGHIPIDTGSTEETAIQTRHFLTAIEDNKA